MRSIKLFVVTVAILFVGYRALGSMIVQEDARVVLSDRVGCPRDMGEKTESGCVVTGNMRRGFISGDTEIALRDGATLVVRPEDVKGYSVLVKGH
jgi:hypothetical protein